MKRFLLTILFFLCCYSLETVWPVSNSLVPDLPQSSPYGPRLKASEGFRFDWHRGVDIPAPECSPLYAIADGEVTINGSSPYYSDGVIQLKHEWNSIFYYSNYLHVNSSYVISSQIVGRGETIGCSGHSVSGFEHLHFEIRKGGRYQKNCINPWSVLPYPGGPSPILINDAWFVDSFSIGVNVSQNASSLIYDAVSLEFLNSLQSVKLLNVSFEQFTASVDDYLTLDYNNQVILGSKPPSNVTFLPEAFSTSNLFANYTLVFPNSVPDVTSFDNVKVTVYGVGEFGEVKTMIIPNEFKKNSASSCHLSMFHLVAFLWFSFCCLIIASR